MLSDADAAAEEAMFRTHLEKLAAKYQEEFSPLKPVKKVNKTITVCLKN